MAKIPVLDVGKNESVDVKTKFQPNYVVIVENDDIHSFGYVVEALQKVCRHNHDKAVRHTMTIHEEGKSPVWEGHKELAELKRDQLKEFGPDSYDGKTIKTPLSVYIEPLAS